MRIEGYSLLRLIAERERSKLFLARDALGKLCAVKLQKPPDSSKLGTFTQQVSRLQPLTRKPGLLEILDHGTSADGWAWKALPLADNLPELPPLETEPGRQQYTPLTLLAWRTNNAPPCAIMVARWGIRLAKALAVLHQAGLVHRDVKPANVLFLNGEPCLGDYGLAGNPGEQIDYRGTEGYQPLEGTSDMGADLFALGKTLYETWTGGNRLEFPSLPREILEAPEWGTRGRALNDVLLRACHAQPRKRFGSAHDFAAALERVITGRQPLNRRRWLAAATTLAATGSAGVFYLAFGRPPARVVWRRVRQQGFNVESWQGHTGTTDWRRGKLYSFCVDTKGPILQALDLASFEMVTTLIAGGPKFGISTIFHPETLELWAVEGGNGDVLTLNTETLLLRNLGGGPCDERHYGARTYWNPFTRRVGILGGYGHFAVRNDRCEFDLESGRWIELEPDREEAHPWRRTGAIPLIPDPKGSKLFLVGGHGSNSGKQGHNIAGLRGFSGQFHYLDDIWELDLKLNTWRCVLPLGNFDPLRIRAAAFFPEFSGLVVFEGMRMDDENPGAAQAWLVRPGIDRRPVRLPTNGEPSRMAVAWSYTMDPQSGELLMFLDDGIFRVALEPA